MPAHETRNTLEVIAWCNVCRKASRHAVVDRRLGHCLEHEAQGVDGGCSRKQAQERKRREKEEREPRLI